jgi:hypothetical protein
MKADMLIRAQESAWRSPAAVLSFPPGKSPGAGGEIPFRSFGLCCHLARPMIFLVMAANRPPLAYTNVNTLFTALRRVVDE